MKFGRIEPRTALVEFVEAENLDAAKRLAGLDPRWGVDHGVLWRDVRFGGIAIVVYEFSLYVPSERQRYFAIYNHLYAGAAVLYGFDAAGESADLPQLPPVVFFGSAAEVERTISAKRIERPVTAIAGVVFWRWPDPPSEEIAERMKAHGVL